MDIHAVYNELVARSMSFDALRQSSHFPPPGHEYDMYSFDLVASCWHCGPCDKNVGYGHLTSTRHKNKLWESVVANLTSAAQHTAAAAVLSAGAPTTLALPAPTAGASWAVASATPAAPTAGPTAAAWAVPAAAAPTVPAPASPVADAAALAATRLKLRSLEDTINVMQQNHQDTLDGLRREVDQLGGHVDGRLEKAQQQVADLNDQVSQLGREVVTLREQVRTLQIQNDGWYQRRDEWQHQ